MLKTQKHREMAEENLKELIEERDELTAMVNELQASRTYTYVVRCLKQRVALVNVHIQEIKKSLVKWDQSV